MPDQPTLLPETIVRIFEELLGTPLPQADSQPVADLVRGLQDDISPMRRMDMGETQPATLFEASPE